MIKRCKTHGIKLRRNATYCPICGEHLLDIKLGPFRVYLSVPVAVLICFSAIFFAIGGACIYRMPYCVLADYQESKILDARFARSEELFDQLPENWKLLYTSINNIKTYRNSFLEDNIAIIKPETPIKPEYLDAVLPLFDCFSCDRKSAMDVIMQYQQEQQEVEKK